MRSHGTNMTVGQELQDWLADRGRQRRTRAATDAFARDWDRGAVHRRFDGAIAALPEQSAEAVADAVQGLFADDGWVDAVIAGLAAKLRDDPFFDPPFPALNSDIHSGLIVFEDERVSIAAGVTAVANLAAKKNAKRGPTSIGFTGRVSVVKFVKAGGARLSFWEAPPITAGFTAAAAGQCRPAGTRALADGDILVLDGRRQSYVIEQARANLLLLQAEITLDQAPLSVEYDSASRLYVGCSATDDGASRIQMLTTLLRTLDCAAAFPAMAAFLDHGDFFVRWHVMKELLGIDAAAALPHLKRMAARDPHPEVRRAARSVLDRLETPRPRQAA
jgi:HEAT repeats